MEDLDNPVLSAAMVAEVRAVVFGAIAEMAASGAFGESYPLVHVARRFEALAVATTNAIDAERIAKKAVTND